MKITDMPYGHIPRAYQLPVLLDNSLLPFPLFK